MCLKKLGMLLLFTAAFYGVKAQTTRYIIQLKNKGTSPYSLSNPSQYLSARSIVRRTRYAIAIDSADLPLRLVILTASGFQVLSPS